MTESELERRVADAVVHLSGPPRPVDERAIHTHVKEQVAWTRGRGWHAQRPKLAAAVVLFALGVTALVISLPYVSLDQADTSMSPAGAVGFSLDGLRTEPVEPGVRRVLNDAAGQPVSGLPMRAIAVDAGAVWLLTLDATVALGTGDVYPALPHRYVYGWPEAVTDRAGTLWAAWCGDPYALEDDAWVANPVPGTASCSLAVSDDGTVWTAGPVLDGAGPMVARADQGGWTSLPTIDDPDLEGTYSDWFVPSTSDGVWVANGVAHAHGTPPRGLLWFDGTSWTEVAPVGDDPAAIAGPLARGANGTLWVFLERSGTSVPGSRSLARLDEQGWTSFGADVGVPNMAPSSLPVVDELGRLWMGLADLGVAAFDGTTWRRFLDGATVRDLAIDPDGRIWVIAGPRGAGNLELYVIEPEPAPAGAVSTGGMDHDG